jgi:hypothetical protein
MLLARRLSRPRRSDSGCQYSKHTSGAPHTREKPNTLEPTFPLGLPVCLLHLGVVCKPVQIFPCMGWEVSLQEGAFTIKTLSNKTHKFIAKSEIIVTSLASLTVTRGLQRHDLWRSTCTAYSYPKSDLAVACCAPHQWVWGWQEEPHRQQSRPSPSHLTPCANNIRSNTRNHAVDDTAAAVFPSRFRPNKHIPSQVILNGKQGSRQGTATLPIVPAIYHLG